MKKHKFERREFVKSTSIGLGSLALSPLFTTANKTSQQNVETTSQKKLNIVCVGAHPGDPEFGCGGTMAKYSDTGNAVTFLYLTRGEAYNDKQAFDKSA